MWTCKDLERPCPAVPIHQRETLTRLLHGLARSHEKQASCRNALPPDMAMVMEAWVVTPPCYPAQWQPLYQIKVSNRKSQPASLHTASLGPSRKGNMIDTVLYKKMINCHYDMRRQVKRNKTTLKKECLQSLVHFPSDMCSKSNHGEPQGGSS